jgi:predicted enzyme related to lactoylglutathione lyase
LTRKGVNFTQKPTKEHWGTYAMLADPDGNEFWLIQE